MKMVLVARDDLKKTAIVHSRTKGSKNGVRLYQYEDGSLTPLGRIHYGVGKARDAAKEEIKDHLKIATSGNSAEKNAAKAQLNEHRSERAKERDDQESVDKFDKRAEKFRSKEQKILDREAKNDRSTSEIKKDVKEKIDNFNEKVKEAKKERDEKVKKAKDKQEEERKEIGDIRALSDEELDKRINRLLKEKQYSELLNERNKRERGPLYEKASKLFEQQAMKLANKTLDKLGDELLKKAFSKLGKNQNQNQNSNQNNGNNSSGNNNNGGNGQKFSKAEKSQIRSMAGTGKSIADIAQALHTTEDKVKSYMSAAGITIS